MHVCKYSIDLVANTAHDKMQCLNAFVAMFVYYKKILKLQNWPHLFIFDDVYLQSLKWL